MQLISTLKTVPTVYRYQIIIYSIVLHFREIIPYEVSFKMHVNNQSIHWIHNELSGTGFQSTIVLA